MRWTVRGNDSCSGPTLCLWLSNLPPRRRSAEDTQDDVAAMHKAIGQLPHDQQAILSLFYVEELSIRNIAEALSLPVCTVKSRLHYARNNLKEVIARRNQ